MTRSFVYLRLLGAATLLLFFHLATDAFAQAERPSVAQPSSAVEAASPTSALEPAVADAVAKGLMFLAARQNDDGSFATHGYGRNPAVVALAGMAWLSSGSTPGRGPYGSELTRAVDYLLEHTEASGFINVPDAASHGPMYGHGFATLFLAEVYGMSARDDLRDKLALAIDLIVRTQNREGGWRYQPRPEDADISVTICQIMALRAARNAGLHVPNETVERCIDFVKRCQNPDGGFNYMLQGGGSAFPRSAAGVVALYSAGMYEGDEIDRGLNYLAQFTPGVKAEARLGLGAGEGHFFYGQYYAVQAMWHAGGERWSTWYPEISKVLLKKQESNGSWQDSICYEYGTAMATIVLQMPDSSLPIFQR